MRISISKTIQRHSFWLSLLLHLLLLLSFVLVLFLQPAADEVDTKKPTLYVPSYVYNGQVPKPVQKQSRMTVETSQTTHTQTNQKQAAKVEHPGKQPKELPMAANGLESLVTLPKPDKSKRSIHHAGEQQAFTSLDSMNPIYLMGDKDEVPDPLIRLLGESLSANFRYPESAGEFGLTGTALVGFMLHPEGYYTDVRLVQSSNVDALDSAALYAVNAAPDVKRASQYLKAPKYLVVGFIFRMG